MTANITNESGLLKSPKRIANSIEHLASDRTMKYIVVTGGTLSGLGKGIAISSLGLCLKSRGYNVTAVKIDPYLNIDAGTMSPFEHGEVFVLDDGEEVDLDLGNYERFLGLNLNNINSITTGKIYSEVINRERKGEYLGKTVQVVPHLTDYIQERLKFAALSGYYDSSDNFVLPDICMVEVGGTVGDIESSVYLEALQQFLFNVGPENIVLIHVCYLPYFGNQLKKKPTQHSVSRLREVGLKPDFLFGRCEIPIDDLCRNQLMTFTQIKTENIISVHTVDHPISVVKLLESQNLADKVCSRLGLEIRKPGKLLEDWNKLIELSSYTDKLNKNEPLPLNVSNPFINGKAKIGIVGKYISSDDTYLSVIESLKYAALNSKVQLEIIWIEATQLESDSNYSDSSTEPLPLENTGGTWDLLKSVDGVLVPGGFGRRGINGKIAAINYCRTNNIPYLGICLGMQLCVIEFSKNVLNLPLATSEEFEEGFLRNYKPISSVEELDLVHSNGGTVIGDEILSPFEDSELSTRSVHVVVTMNDFTSNIKGGTMRLGGWNTMIRDKNSLAYKLYNACRFQSFTTLCTETGEEIYTIRERHRHRYEINPEFVPLMEKFGLKFVGKDLDVNRNEIVELPSHPFFIAAQYHPEFTSRPMNPNPLFYGLVLASVGKIKHNEQMYDFV
ncbi:CTP synthetase (UTP-ammonia lyase) [Cryptosporidium xiaoi]|uniref:CTP synthase n=1 Tax=Cryptosporidium xiaoi TaxID=659607 RepID=A0AAV9XWA6_9CRYT